MKTKRLSHKCITFYAIVLAGILLDSGCNQESLAKQVNGSHWIGTLASSVQEMGAKLMPSEFQQLNDTTWRQVVRVSAGGEKLRIRFSNAFAEWRDNLQIDEACITVPNDGQGSGFEIVYAMTGCSVISPIMISKIAKGS